MIADSLRQAVLQSAVSGKLTNQRPDEGTAAELLEEIRAEHLSTAQAKARRKQDPSPPLLDTETPFELPDSWKWVRLRELASYVQRGKSPSYADTSPYLAVSQKCVQWSGFDASRGRPYVRSAFESLGDVRLLRAGDILWNSTGTGTVGRVLTLTDDDVNPAPPMSADSHVTVIRCITGVLPEYLTAYLSSPNIQLNIDELTSGTTKQQELNRATILDLPVPLAPRAEQSRVLGLISDVLPLIDQLATLERERKTLEVAFERALERAILQAAVTGQLTRQCAEDGTTADLLGQITVHRAQLMKERRVSKLTSPAKVRDDERALDIPEHWTWTRLGEIGSWKSGTTPSRSQPAFYGGDIPWVKSGEVKQGRISTISETVTSAAMESTSLRLNPKGSVLVAMYGANIGDVGILAIDATTNQAVCACIPYSGIDPQFVLQLIRFLKPYFVSISAGGAQPNISQGKVMGAPIPLPPAAEQRRIAEKLDALLPLARITVP